MHKTVILPQRPKILFLRQDRIGDVFVSTPVVAAVRKRYPDAQIHFLLSRNNNAASFALRSNVDRIHVLHKSLFSLLRLFFELRKERFDLVIDLNHTKSTTSAILLRAAAATSSIVLETSVQSAATYVVPQGDRSRRHIIDVLCDLVQPLGIEIPQDQRRPIVPIQPDKVKDVRRAIDSGDKKILGIQISGSSEDRTYPTTAMKEVIEQLSVMYPAIAIILLASPVDHDRARLLESETTARFIDTGSSYESFAAAIALCDWLLSPDTAAVHVAAAHNIPSVVLYSRDRRGFLNWFPYDTVSEPIITEHSSISAIHPKEVVGNVVSLMSR